MKFKRGWIALILLGGAIFSLGAGMRGVAQTEQRDLISRLLAARPAQPDSLRARLNTPLLPTEAGVPQYIELIDLGLWNPLMPVYAQDSGLIWRTGDAVWHVPSGVPGMASNIVFAGHSPSHDPQTWSHSIFRGLPRLVPGDRIKVRAGDLTITYEVARTFAIPAQEANSPEAAAWIAPTGDERLTLVTCYPPHTADYRVIVVAFPVLVQQHTTQIGLGGLQ